MGHGQSADSWLLGSSPSTTSLSWVYIWRTFRESPFSLGKVGQANSESQSTESETISYPRLTATNSTFHAMTLKAAERVSSLPFSSLSSSWKHERPWHQLLVPCTYPGSPDAESLWFVLWSVTSITLSIALLWKYQTLLPLQTSPTLYTWSYISDPAWLKQDFKAAHVACLLYFSFWFCPPG